MVHHASGTPSSTSGTMKLRLPSSSVDSTRVSQVSHALNKVFFGELLVTVILSYFAGKNMSLSMMCQTFPNCKKETRQDLRQKAAVEAYRNPAPLVVYDADGSVYTAFDAGLSVLVDGELAAQSRS